MTIFKILYWLGLVAEVIIRAPWQTKRKQAARAEQRITGTEQALLWLLLIGGIILPLIYSLTDWLDFADYRLPVWMGWLGVALLAGALYVFARAHTDLKTNWSPSLELYKGHSLVTNGIYSVIRHPMYASQWLLAMAQALLLWNWIAGLAGLVVFIPFYIFRTRAEDRMMMDAFGDEYHAYKQRTGGVLPKRIR